MTEFESLEFESIAELTDRYLRGDLDPGELEQLEQALLTDEASGEMFLEVVLQAGTMREVFAEQQRFRQSMGEASPEAYLAFLRSLAPTQEVEPVQWGGTSRTPQSQGVLGWLKQPTAVIGVGIAAVLAIAITLVVVFNGPNKPGGALVVESPGHLKEAYKPVATLTATHNAKWAQKPGEDLRRGSVLHDGDRLTLTKGFAEITTNDGAVAIIQAPATIELLNNDNAIRLHNGKLVGICETESSKGFVVHTPQMDITDMGTRFGVDATQAQQTDVHVFEGKVRVALPQGGASGDTQQVLSTGQSIAAQSNQDRLMTITPIAERFVSLRDKGPVSPRESLKLPGVLKMTGDLTAAPSSAFIGIDPGLWPDGEQAFVFQEFEGKLAQQVKVDIAEPAETNQRPSDARPTIPAGTSIRSYIVIKASGPKGETENVQGSISFDDDILGVIVDAETADGFGRAMGSKPRLFTPGGGTHRWVDPNTVADLVSISADKRTLTFKFEVKDSSDTVRVFVLTKDLDRRLGE